MLDAKRLEAAAVHHCLDSVELTGFGTKMTGKVRDIYRQNDKLILITTDRVSAFDRVLGLIPYKGQVLNQLSAWWFEQTADLIKNHVVAVPDPNVAIGRVAEPLPIEVVVRGYITGVTTTSLWYMYENGARNPYGVTLPDGLQKNDPLPYPIITPTTKAQDGAHDEPITPAEILAQGIVSVELWQKIEQTALALFKRGQELAFNSGLILVDTKYEMGLIDSELALIDEIHTPDSSRYWRIGADGSKENYSKEFLREWYAVQGYIGDGVPPTMPAAFRAKVAAQYIAVYEMLTGQEFVPATEPAAMRITENLAKNLAKNLKVKS